MIVVNPKARSGQADLTRVLDTLSAVFGAPQVLGLDDPQPLAERLGASGAHVEVVAVAGGDGTVNAVLPALVTSGKALGLIPLGTANDLARTLSVPLDPEEAAKVIVAGRTRRIDVGVVNGRLFVNAAGIGFSSLVQDELSGQIKAALGPLAYAASVLRRWRRHQPFTVLVGGDGPTNRHRVLQVTVANGRFYGGGMTARQDARIDDGELDLVMVLARPWWRHLPSIVSLKRGVYGRNGPVIAQRGAAFELRTRRPKPIATDGEPQTWTPASFCIRPRALEVFVPHELA